MCWGPQARKLDKKSTGLGTPIRLWLLSASLLHVSIDLDERVESFIQSFHVNPARPAAQMSLIERHLQRSAAFGRPSLPPGSAALQRAGVTTILRKVSPP